MSNTEAVKNGIDMSVDVDEVEVESLPNIPVERVRQYNTSHKGPFVVYIRSKDGERIKPVTVTKLLFSNFSKKLKRVDQVNAFKLRVTCATMDDANELPKSAILSALRVYIPASEVETDGVISLEIEDNIQEVVSTGKGVFDNSSIPEVKVLQAFRLSRNVIDEDGKTEKKATTAVRVTFEGTLLPQRLVLDGLRIPVRLYRPLEMFCEKCQRTGHTKKYCTNQPKCAKCEGDHLTSACTSTEPPKVCVLCKTEHVNHSRAACPKMKEADERKLNKAKKQQHFSYAEAVNSISMNPFAPLIDVDEPSDSCSIDDNVSVGTRKRRRVQRRRQQPAVPQNIPTLDKKTIPDKSTHIRKQQPHNQKASGSAQQSNSSSSIEWVRSLLLKTLQSIAQSMGFSPFLYQAAHMVINFFFDHLATPLWILLQQHLNTNTVQ